MIIDVSFSLIVIQLLTTSSFSSKKEKEKNNIYNERKEKIKIKNRKNILLIYCFFPTRILG